MGSSLAKFSRDRQSLFAVSLDSVRLYLYWRYDLEGTWPLAISLIRGSRFGSSLSLLDLSQFGASLALRNFSRLGRGSSLSLRGFSRLGDSLSLFGSARYGSSLAVLGDTPGFVSIASLGSAIGRVAFRLIFLPDRVLDGIAEPLPRREISLGSNLLPMTLREKGLGSVGIGILWLSLLSREVLESVQLGRAAALPLWSWASMGCLSIG